MIAALYVQPKGCYANLPDVDPWPESRDARTYEGPWPVVAHPPCARWSKLAGQVEHRYGIRRGDDGGCFALVLDAVREWGGVLEHPEGSAAWRAHGLLAPPRAGGWVAAGDGIGWTCCVDQGHYGHAAGKATWLYAAKVHSLPSLIWGRHARPRAGLTARQVRTGICQRLSKNQRAATPIPFRDLLLSIARSAVAQRNGGAHHPANMRVLCLTCNSRKSGLIDKRGA